jgi:hypothetical protein
MYNGKLFELISHLKKEVDKDKDVQLNHNTVHKMLSGNCEHIAESDGYQMVISYPSKPSSIVQAQHSVQVDPKPSEEDYKHYIELLDNVEVEAHLRMYCCVDRVKFLEKKKSRFITIFTAVFMFFYISVIAGSVTLAIYANYYPLLVILLFFSVLFWTIYFGIADDYKRKANRYIDSVKSEYTNSYRLYISTFSRKTKDVSKRDIESTITDLCHNLSYSDVADSFIYSNFDLESKRAEIRNNKELYKSMDVKKLFE